MEENQELTDIELSEETIDNLNQGTVEIKTEITKNGNYGGKHG